MSEPGPRGRVAGLGIVDDCKAVLDIDLTGKLHFTRNL